MSTQGADAKGIEVKNICLGTKGSTEGVQRLQVGGMAKLTCPPAIAYGANGRSGIPPNATLHFEVELLGITRP